jgi:hypothetical protein
MGTLLYRTGEPSSAGGYWMVSIVNGGQGSDSVVQEEVSERTLGLVVDAAESDRSTVTVPEPSKVDPPPVVPTTKTTTTTTTNKTTTTTTKAAIKKAPPRKTVPPVRRPPPAVSRKATRSTRSSPVELLAGIEHVPVTKKMTSKRNCRKDGNVTKVKLLTGTLYLYKGQRPFRAEFMRTK